MDKPTYQFSDFLADVRPDYHGFAEGIHASLLAAGYKMKMERKANGFLVSYAHPETRRSLLNFVFRKHALVVRIYADHLGGYMDFLRALPEAMEKEISRAPVCKRLIDPADCNSRCPMGYDFFVGETQYKKCRYSCFMFPVNPENIPVLEEFIALERKARV